jgi:hypothetical protein
MKVLEVILMERMMMRVLEKSDEAHHMFLNRFYFVPKSE